MGSFIKRSNGIYYGVFVSETGKRIWRSTGTRNLEDAAIVYRKLSADYISWKKLTVSEFRDTLIPLLRGTLADTTIRLYDQALSTLVKTTGNCKLKSIQPYHIEQFKVKRLSRVSAVKVNLDYRTLRAAFNRAVHLKMISENPFSHSKNIPIPPQEPRFLTKSEFEQLLTIIGHNRLRQIVILAVSTGMRAGEILHLQWKEVDIKNGFIHLQNKSDFQLKGRRGRTIPLNETACNILMIIPRESEDVFPNEKRKKNPVASVSRKFKQAIRNANLPDELHFHSLRHTAASWLIQQGVPITYVQRILGHTNISTTLIYSHQTDDHLRTAVKSIDSFMCN